MLRVLLKLVKNTSDSVADLLKEHTHTNIFNYESNFYNLEKQKLKCLHCIM